MAHKLFTQYVPRQMEAPLPPPLKRTVAKARASYVSFVAEINIGTITHALQRPRIWRAILTQKGVRLR